MLDGRSEVPVFLFGARDRVWLGLDKEKYNKTMLRNLLGAIIVFGLVFGIRERSHKPLVPSVCDRPEGSKTSRARN